MTSYIRNNKNRALSLRMVMFLNANHPLGSGALFIFCSTLDRSLCIVFLLCLLHALHLLILCHDKEVPHGVLHLLLQLILWLFKVPKKTLEKEAVDCLTLYFCDWRQITDRMAKMVNIRYEATHEPVSSKELHPKVLSVFKWDSI